MSLYHAAEIVSHLSLSLSGFLLRINKLLNYRKEKKRTEKKITDWAALGPAHIEHPSNHRGRLGVNPEPRGSCDMRSRF